MTTSAIFDQARVLLATHAGSLRKSMLPLLLLLLAGLYLWLPGKGSSAFTLLQDEVLTLRSQAAELEAQAVALQGLAALPQLAVSSESLLVQVRAAIMRAGLDDKVLQSAADGPDQVTVTAAVLDFAVFLAWLDELQALNIHVSSIRMNVGDTPGLVSIDAVLLRPVLP